MWFYVATGVFLLTTSAGILMKVTKPLDNYETAGA